MTGADSTSGSSKTPLSFFANHCDAMVFVGNVAGAGTRLRSTGSHHRACHRPDASLRIEPLVRGDRRATSHLPLVRGGHDLEAIGGPASRIPLLEPGFPPATHTEEASVSFLPVAIDAIRDDVLALSAEDLAEFAAALLDSLGARSPTPTRTRWIAPGPPNSNAVQRRLTPGIPADEALVKVRQSLVE